jgi:hypothetical protein
MKRHRLIKSEDEKAWLFDAEQQDDLLVAGFACFAPGCASEVAMEIGGSMETVLLPSRTVGSPVPMRMANARLFVLPKDKQQ